MLLLMNMRHTTNRRLLESQRAKQTWLAQQRSCTDIIEPFVQTPCSCLSICYSFPCSCLSICYSFPMPQSFLEWPLVFINHFLHLPLLPLFLYKQNLCPIGSPPPPSTYFIHLGQQKHEMIGIEDSFCEKCPLLSLMMCEILHRLKRGMKYFL